MRPFFPLHILYRALLLRTIAFCVIFCVVFVQRLDYDSALHIQLLPDHGYIYARPGREAQRCIPWSLIPALITMASAAIISTS